MSAETYLLVKWVHVGCAVLSVAGFCARGVLMLGESAWLHTRFARIAPHVVDSVLLASAIGLSVSLGQYPLAHGWLTAKVVALLGYIVLGSLALRPGRSKAVRAAAFAGALVSAAYIISVALTRDARGLLAWWG